MTSACKGYVRQIQIIINFIKDLFMIKEELKHVEDFHNAFGLGVAKKPTIDLSQETIKLRFNLMKEENEEYYEAAKRNDMIEVADALGDMLYILCGTILSHGMQNKILEIFEEIQRSNMSKLDEDVNQYIEVMGK